MVTAMSTNNGKVGKPGHIPSRMCVVCRCIKPRPRLYRLVRQKGWLRARLDSTGNIPGRGLYICREGECLERFLMDKKFRRRYHQAVEDQAFDTLREIFNGVKGLVSPAGENNPGQDPDSQGQGR